MNPKDLLASEDVLKKIEAVCKRRFPNENDADQCYTFIIDGLKASDYKRLRSFQGKSSLKTYLFTVMNALASDFKRKKYGRKRIPKAVTKIGEWAEAVYRLVCWQKYSFPEAYDIAIIQGLFSGALSDFLSKTDSIRRAPCPENPEFMGLNHQSGDPFLQVSDTTANPLDQLIEGLESERKFKAVNIIREVTASLSEEDQLLVRLIYGSDQSVSAASKVVGLSPKAGKKRIKGILTRFRENLLAEGIREP